jgi:hypothetical protein
MAAKKKKPAKGSKRSAAKAPRKAKAPRATKKTSAKRAAPPRRAKAKAKAKPVAKKKVAKKSAPKRVAAKPIAKTKAAPSAPRAKPIQRRDATGHLDPKYASDLRALTPPHEDDTTAFLGGSRSSDDLAEELGEEVVETATSGEYEAEEALNQTVPEDRGGPFVPSTAGAEFGNDDDESNPKDATREPFPTT